MEQKPSVLITSAALALCLGLPTIAQAYSVPKLSKNATELRNTEPLWISFGTSIRPAFGYHKYTDSRGDQLVMDDGSSRFGLAGGVNPGQGSNISGFFKIELRVRHGNGNVDTTTVDAGDLRDDSPQVRHSYAGLKTPYGTVRLGQGYSSSMLYAFRDTLFNNSSDRPEVARAMGYQFRRNGFQYAYDRKLGQHAFGLMATVFSDANNEEGSGQKPRAFDQYEAGLRYENQWLKVGASTEYRGKRTEANTDLVRSAYGLTLKPMSGMKVAGYYLESDGALNEPSSTLDHNGNGYEFGISQLFYTQADLRWQPYAKYYDLTLDPQTNEQKLYGYALGANLFHNWGLRTWYELKQAFPEASTVDQTAAAYGRELQVTFGIRIDIAGYVGISGRTAASTRLHD